jgi:2-oxoglutarate dehydrogenase E1 component
VRLKPDSLIRRVVLCSGKVYYDLFEEREARGMDDVQILRIEQLHPFPAKSVLEFLRRFPQAEIVWCQEEPKNMGAGNFVDPYLEWVLAQLGRPAGHARYAGRPAAAATATGLMTKHLKELKTLLDEALATE